MYTEQLQRWADNAAYAAGKAYNQGKQVAGKAYQQSKDAAGKAYSQGKDVFYTTRDKSYDAARRAAKIRENEIKNARAYIPRAQSQWHTFVDDIGNRFTRVGDRIHGRFHSTEQMLLRVGAIFLAFKLFSHRHKPVTDMAAEVKTRVKDRPIESAIIALGIGYALGKILR